MASRISDIGCPRGAASEAAQSNNRRREKQEGRHENGEHRCSERETAGRTAFRCKSTEMPLGYACVNRVPGWLLGRLSTRTPAKNAKIP